MLRRIAALLALLLGLATLATAQEPSSTRNTPPPGRALPADAALSGTAHQPADATRPSPASDRPAGAQPAAPPLQRSALSQPLAVRRAALLEARLTAAPPTATPAHPAVVPAPGRFAHDRDQWRSLDRTPASGLPLRQPGAAPLTTLAATMPAAPLQANWRAGGLDPLLIEVQGSPAGLAAHEKSTLFAGAGASFSDNQASAPVDLALPVGQPRMPPITLRPGLFEITHGSPKQKRVALTFDDGPHPEYTSQLLAILDYYHVHATFFVVGLQAQKYPQWVKMIHQAGHEIGNHTYDHFRLPALPAEEAAYQIDENQRLLEQLTGITPRFFRPPGGRYGTQVSKLLQQRGMLLAFWDVALNDTAEDREAGDLYSTASHKIRPGSIVLGHDGIQATIDMLPQLIESLQAEGYSFVTMSELVSGM
jgi:peptidoglycan/xylan/chitin deacetylase (PgdA/CDA1 family)